MTRSFLGLDIGTNSIGWALTDEEFNIKELNGKAARGSRLFDEAHDSKERRSYRTSKRRSQRRKSRIFLLNKMFEKPILSIDDSFFIRLKESNLSYEAGDKDFKYPLFNNKTYEKEYYKKYPTIYHLRNALANDDPYAFSDVRFLYLALHHIIKYRGNFLIEGKFNNSSLDESIILEVNSALNHAKNEILGEVEEFSGDDSIYLENDFLKKLTENLLSKETSKKEKDSYTKSLFALTTSSKCLKPYVDMFSSLVNGGSYDVKKLRENYKDIEDSLICFDDKYDDKIERLSKEITDDVILIECAHKIYEFIFLKKILGDNTLISKSFVEKFEEHKEDLKELKGLIKEIDANSKEKTSLYDVIFKLEPEKDKVNYLSFISGDRTKVAEFNSYIKSKLEENISFLSEKSQISANEIIKKCDNKSFLLKISNFSTSSIPHQLHEMELDIILNNAKRHFYFVNDEFVSRIKKIFLFKIPYYYGPFNSKTNSNIVLKEGHENERINFDNFNSIIDVEKTKEKFINVRLNFCEYLLSEKTLPKNSIAYTFYVLLDRLNTMKVNGVSLDFNDKRSLISYMLQFSEVSISKVKQFFKNRFNTKDVLITGINDGDKFVIYPINEFFKIYKSQENLVSHLEEIEDIIKILTIYKDNSKDGVEVLKKKYKEFTKDECKIISSMRFNGFGSLSYKLLFGIRNETNKTVLETMYFTNKNFQQTIQEYLPVIKSINDEMFMDSEDDKNRKVNEIIENTPAIFRRPIIQTLKIIKEVSHFNKALPDVIALEVTREDLSEREKELKATKKREKIISDLLKQASILNGDDYATNLIKNNLVKVKDNFDRLKDKIKLQSKHIYLYFLQLGIDMYTGKAINFDDVLHSTGYDIDHIWPQSKIKDDSLDNTVLVSREVNQKDKKDIYPLSREIRENMRGFWKLLYDKKMISPTKYYRLTRQTALTEEELNDFVNRQLNVVNYSNRVLRDIINIKYGDKVEVVFSKAQYPHGLRQAYGIYKIRELNDAHHAIDAYLNVVAGVTLHELYGNIRYIKAVAKNKKVEEKDKDYDKSNNFMKRLLGYLKYNDYKDKVINNCFRDDILLTVRESYADGDFYNMTKFKKDGKDKGKTSLIPIHSKGPMNNTVVYGGYKSLFTSFMVIGSYRKKDEIKKGLIPVSTLLVSECTKNKILDNDLLKKEILKRNPDYFDLDINHKIYNYTKVKIDGKYYGLASNNASTCSLTNFNQLFLNKEDTYLLYMLMKRYDGKDVLTLNRFGEVFEFNREIYIDLLLKIITKVKSKIDDSYTGINKFDEKYIDKLAAKSIQDLKNEFVSFLKLISRAPDIKWRPSLRGVLSYKDLTIMSESVTGLIIKPY